MEAVNANDQGLAAEGASAPNERIATLEERSLHAATKAELHRAMLWLYVALLTTISGLLGGLMLHLHNRTQADIAELRALMHEILQRLPGG
ncbi:MAG: hypothetical protein OXG85_08280 [Chloroflexi bacterium]|nr:hypothetical protein [Chloroflexota bacterium]